MTFNKLGGALDSTRVAWRTETACVLVWLWVRSELVVFSEAGSPESGRDMYLVQIYTIRRPGFWAHHVLSPPIIRAANDLYDG